MVLYSKFAHGSQLSGEKKDLRIRYLVTEILSKKNSLILFGTPCIPDACQYYVACYMLPFLFDDCLYYFVCFFLYLMMVFIMLRTFL